MILEDIEHFVGNHCSSSAIQTVLAYDGLELSEALIFGLSSGLGFFYNIEAGSTPSRRFNGRAPDLEGNFYRLVGKNLNWAKEWNIELIKNSLNNKRPIIAQTDIFPIPYYDDSHFIGHGLLVVGIEKDTVIVADIAASEFLEMPISAFKAAVNVEHYPLLERYHYASVPIIKNIDIEKLLPIALKKTILYMLEPPTINEGLSAMQLFAEDLVNWGKLSDSHFCARFGYQAIEKRGTGGGNFRLLFADFLEESRNYFKLNKQLIVGFRNSAILWTKLAQTLKQAAFAHKAEQAKLFECSSQLTKEIIDLEKPLFIEMKQAILRS